MNSQQGYQTQPYTGDTTRSVTYIVQKKPVEVVGHIVEKETVLESWEGREKAYPGDIQVWNIEGETYAVPEVEFPRLYSQLQPYTGKWPRKADNPNPRFGPFDFKAEDGYFIAQKRPRKLLAFQTYQKLKVLRLKDEPLLAREGDWVIVYKIPRYWNGKLMEMDAYPCEWTVFNRTYEIVGESEYQVVLPAFTHARIAS